MSHHWDATERRLAQKQNAEHKADLDFEERPEPGQAAADQLADEITMALMNVGICARDAANGSKAVAIVLRRHAKPADAPAETEDLRIGRIVATLLDGRIQINAYALAFATGLDQVGMLGSASAAAVRLGVTRAAMTKAINKWRDELGVFSRYSRSERTREACAKAQRKLTIKRQICFK